MSMIKEVIFNVLKDQYKNTNDVKLNDLANKISDSLREDFIFMKRPIHSCCDCFNYKTRITFGDPGYVETCVYGHTPGIYKADHCDDYFECKESKKALRDFTSSFMYKR